MAALSQLCVLLISLLLTTNANAHPHAPRAPPNLLKNGGFESRTLSPWTFEAAFSNNNAGYEIAVPGLTEGQHYFKYFAYTAYNPGAEGPDAGFTIQQDVATVVGATYRLSFDYYSRPRGVERGDAYVIRAGGAMWDSENTVSRRVAHFKGNFTATAASSSISITFYSDPYYSYDSSQLTKLDNAMVIRL